MLRKQIQCWIRFSSCEVYGPICVTWWVAFISVGVGKCQSEDSFVCFGAKATQDRKRMREERSESQQKWTGQRTDQLTEKGSRQKRAGAITCGLRSGLANVRGWVSIPYGFVEISLEYMLTLAHRCTESYAKMSQTSPFLRLELTQVCLFSFLPPSRLYILCFVCP